MRVSNSNS